VRCTCDRTGGAPSQKPRNHVKSGVIMKGKNDEEEGYEGEDIFVIKVSVSGCMWSWVVWNLEKWVGRELVSRQSLDGA